MGLDSYWFVNSRKAAEDSKRWHEEHGYGDKLFGNAVKNGRFAYWRKANHIHGWLENRVAGEHGMSCGPLYPVSLELVEELRNDCKAVLDSSVLVEKTVNETVFKWDKDKGDGGWVKVPRQLDVLEDDTVAAELLPREQGFFFGSQWYDADYVEETRYTMELCNFVLENMAEWRRDGEHGVYYDWDAEWPGDDGWCFELCYYASW